MVASGHVSQTAGGLSSGGLIDEGLYEHMHTDTHTLVCKRENTAALSRRLLLLLASYETWPAD